MSVRIALTIIALAAGAADARPFSGIGGGAQLHYELSTLHDIAHDAAASRPTPQDFVMAGARLHGFVGGKRFGYHVGLDLAAGQTARPHSFLAYDVAFFPIGLAVRFAETSFITLGAGIGAMGAVGTLNDATTIPLELRFEVGRGIRVLGRARVSYVNNARDRMDGGVSTSFGDELEASLGLRLGRGYNEWGFPTGDGYFVAANYRESLGARYVGLTLGFSIDMGTYRTKRQSRYDDDDSRCENCD